MKRKFSKIDSTSSPILYKKQCHLNDLLPQRHPSAWKCAKKKIPIRLESVKETIIMDGGTPELAHLTGLFYYNIHNTILKGKSIQFKNQLYSVCYNINVFT